VAELQHILAKEITSSEKVLFNAKPSTEYFWKTTTVFAVVFFGSTPLSLVSGYTEIGERLRERLGWREGLETNDDSKNTCAAPNVIY
jgi:hypothetical protein